MPANQQHVSMKDHQDECYECRKHYFEGKLALMLAKTSPEYGPTEDDRTSHGITRLYLESHNE